MSDEVRAELLKDIQRRLTPQAVKIRADIELRCFKYEGIRHIQFFFVWVCISQLPSISAGIDAIKDALREGLKLSNEDMPVQIKLVAPPLYVVTTTSLDRDEGIALLRQVCAAIQTRINESGGEFSIKQEARAITEKDEKLLSSLLESLEMQNRQVDGDDDDDEE